MKPSQKAMASVVVADPEADLVADLVTGLAAGVVVVADSVTGPEAGTAAVDLAEVVVVGVVTAAVAVALVTGRALELLVQVKTIFQF